jgi:colanic acid/amylovoran biosynthesis glycosyltransferase
VATRHGAFPEGIAPGNARWLVPERDGTALALQLRELVKAHEEWPAIGRAGRQFVEQRYDIRALNARLVDIYRQSIAAYCE